MHLLPSAERVGLQGLASRVWDSFSSIEEAAVSLHTFLKCISSYQFTEKTERAASKLAADRDELTVLLAKWSVAMNLFLEKLALGPCSALPHDVTVLKMNQITCFLSATLAEQALRRPVVAKRSLLSAFRS